MLIENQRLEDRPHLLLRRIEQAAREDTAAEASKKKNGIAGCAFFAGAFLGLFLTGPLSDRLDSSWPFLVNLGLAVTAIVFWVRTWRASREDLDNRKLDSVRKLLQMLHVDMTSEKKALLEVDFRGYGKVGPVTKGGWTGGERRLSFVQPWLKLDATLADGSRLRVGVVDAVGRKERKKRKYTKIKERFTTKVAVVVRVTERQGEAEALAKAFTERQPPRGLRLRGAAGRAGRLVVSFAGDPVVRVGRSTFGTDSAVEGITAGDELIGAVAWVYAGLAPKKG